MKPGVAINTMARVTVCGWFDLVNSAVEYRNLIGIGKARDIAKRIQQEMEALETLERIVCEREKLVGDTDKLEVQDG